MRTRQPHKSKLSLNAYCQNLQLFSIWSGVYFSNIEEAIYPKKKTGCEWQTKKDVRDKVSSRVLLLDNRTNAYHFLFIEANDLCYCFPSSFYYLITVHILRFFLSSKAEVTIPRTRIQCLRVSRSLYTCIAFELWDKKPCSARCCVKTFAPDDTCLVTYRWKISHYILLDLLSRVSSSPPDTRNSKIRALVDFILAAFTRSNYFAYSDGFLSPSH